jgi:hypothetical protein
LRKLYGEHVERRFGSILTLLTTVFGTVRSVFERNLPSPEASAVHRQLVLMCIAYLEAVRKIPPRGASAASQREQTRGFGQSVV